MLMFNVHVSHLYTPITDDIPVASNNLMPCCDTRIDDASAEIERILNTSSGDIFQVSSVCPLALASGLLLQDTLFQGHDVPC